MKKRKYEKEQTRIEVADFETTVYKDQTYTEVWSAATVQIGTEDVHVFHSIDELFDYYCSLEESLTIYFHNLKFDGQFILYYIINVLHYEEAVKYGHDDIEHDDFEFREKWFMSEKSYKYIISEKGQWYSILVKINGCYLEFKDSLKLLPFSVRQIGKAFKTKHQKMDMVYEGFRYTGCEITDKEMEYIKNDVLVVKEALEIMFKQGHNKSTIGACCLTEFKATYDFQEYQVLFPNLYEIPVDDSFRPPGYKPPETEEERKKEKKYTAGDYILRSYRGGWCYLDKTKANRVITNGTTADVNSLYPSMMSSESGNAYPVGEPVFWKGNYIPEEAQDGNHYFFIRFSTRFNLRKGYLPFVQIKRCVLYKPNECLETTDYIDKDGYRHKYITVGGRLEDTRQTLTMTMTDYRLFLEHYEVSDFEILDGCYFMSSVGIFDSYINKYKQIKLESTGAIRSLAKLFLNNLYGQEAKTTNSSFKLARMKDDGVLGYIAVTANKKKPGYIPCGSAITSYARNFTIRAAQKNYHPGSRGFCYADTDSIHCDLSPEEITGITVHDKNFCCWKLESCWDQAIFVRQKTYIEHVTHEDLKPTKPYNNIKCAGMTEHTKMILNLSLEGTAKEEGYTEEGIHKNWKEYEYNFLFKDGKTIKRELTGFKIGLKVPGQLKPKTIKGGVVLYDDYFTIR